MQWIMYALIVVLGLTALMGSSLAVGGWALKRALRRLRAHRRVPCPHLRQSIDCTLSWDTKTSRWHAVERCPVFTSPGEVHCDQSCLRLLN